MKVCVAFLIWAMASARRASSCSQMSTQVSQLLQIQGFQFMVAFFHQ